MPQARAAKERPPFTYSATNILLAINVVVFAGQLVAAKYFPRFGVDDYFALSLDGIRHGYFWQLLTFQFLHGGFSHLHLNSDLFYRGVLHIFVNCWVIYIFGRVIELSLGWRPMLRIYLLSGVIGGVTQLLGMWLFPSLLPDAAIVGASAGAAGLVAAFAVLYPREKLLLFLFFIIPLRMRAASMLGFFVAISVFGIFYPLLARFIPQNFIVDAMFANVAHAAHLGGVVAGWLMARRFIRRPAPPVIETPKTPLNATSVGD